MYPLILAICKKKWLKKVKMSFKKQCKNKRAKMSEKQGKKVKMNKKE